jgi:hypothetical protein
LGLDVHEPIILTGRWQKEMFEDVAALGLVDYLVRVGVAGCVAIDFATIVMNATVLAVIR